MQQKEKSQRLNEVDGVKEEGDARDNMKHIETSDQ